MNFIVISPHFPANFEQFSVSLSNNGITTLGIGDKAYDELTPSLRTALHEYYRVDDMEYYDQMYRAVAYFAFKYGKIDRLESHNEYWLFQDAKLRTDFNIPGYKSDEMDKIKYKSKMKQVFLSHDIPVALGKVFQTAEEGWNLLEQFGYPVIVKPDSGVGASDTYKISTPEDFTDFLTKRNPDVTYFMEEFIKGDIITFDGLTDQNGRVVFYSSLVYQEPALDTVHRTGDMYFYETRDIDADLYELGMKSVAAFDIRERFFHFEFFRTADDKLYALEINCRPPGGPSIDLMNHAHQLSLFEEYAHIVKENKFYGDSTCPYYSVYISRSNKQDYRYDLDNIKQKYGDELKEIQHVPGVFAEIMGDVGYIFNTETKEQMHEIIEFVGALKMQA